MKKILKLLLTLTPLASGVSTTVSCGKTVEHSDFQDAPQKYEYYDLFDKGYLSVEDAIDDVADNQAVKENFTGTKNTLSLNGKEVDTMQGVYDKVYADSELTYLTTSRNPDDYKIDANGQLAPEIDVTGDESIDVYEDADHRAVFADSKKSVDSEALAKESYKNKIEQEYYVDGKRYKNKDTLTNYLTAQYPDENTITEEQLYPFSSKLVIADDLDALIEQSIRSEVDYNGVTYNTNDLANLSNIKLSVTDDSKIHKVAESPGYFYVGQNPGTDGVLSGSMLLQSTTNLSSYVMNKENWSQVESDSSSALDVIQNFIIIVITQIASALIPINKAAQSNQEIDFEEIKYATPVDVLTVPNVVAKYTDDDIAQVEYYTNLIDKYTLSGDLEFLETNLASSNLTDTQKEDLLMFKFSELIRNSNATSDEIDQFRIFTKKALKLRNPDESWQDLVDLIATDDALDVWSYLVDATSYKQKANPQIINVLIGLEDKIATAGRTLFNIASNTIKIVENSATLAKEAAEATAKTAGVITEGMDKTLKKLSKMLKTLKSLTLWFGIVGAVINILDMIPVLEKETWELIVPNRTIDNQQKLSYTFSKFVLDSTEFDPGKILSTFKITDPVAAERFEYNGSYFNTRESAERRVKQDVIKTLSDGNKIRYYSQNYDSIKESDVTKLIASVKAEIMKNPQTLYTDHFGEKYPTAAAAYANLQKLRVNKEYPMIYSFDYNGLKFSSSSLEEVEQFIDENLFVDKKTVLWSDLYKTNDFNKLNDKDAYQYNIVSIKIRGKVYYFTDEWQAVNYAMKLNNFVNTVSSYDYDQYQWRGIEFDSKLALEKYILENINKITVDSEQEVYDHVVKN